MEGLVQFTVVDGQLNGTWKKGLDKGPMRGKWQGALIDVPKDVTEQQTKEEIKIQPIFFLLSLMAKVS